MPLRLATPREERCGVIIETIRQQSKPSFDDICQALRDRGLSDAPRTVRADIAALKQSCMAGDRPAPIEFRRENNRYYYVLSDPSWEFENDAITERDCRAIAFARDLLKQYGDLPLINHLDSVAAKLLDLTDEKTGQKLQNETTGIRVQGEGAAGPVAFSPVIREKINAAVWRTIIAAIEERKAVLINYDKQRAWNQDGAETRLIHPWSVVCLGDIWYLLGSAGKGRMDLRQYKMSLITTAKMTKDAAPRPKGWDIDKVLENTFGRFIGDPKALVNVEVCFKSKVGPLVREQKFHSQERKILHKDGSTTVRFPVTPLGARPELRFFHVRSWLLSWGENAEVIEPQELRDLMASDIRKMRNLYGAG